MVDRSNGCGMNVVGRHTLSSALDIPEYDRLALQLWAMELETEAPARRCGAPEKKEDVVADYIEFSAQPILVDAVGFQSLVDAVEVVDYDEINLLLDVVAVTGGGAFTVEIWTGLQAERDSGWVRAATFSSQSGAASEKRTITGMLRYVRWRVTALTASCTATFTLAGVVRRYGV